MEITIVGSSIMESLQMRTMGCPVPRHINNRRLRIKSDFVKLSELDKEKRDIENQLSQYDLFFLLFMVRF